MLDAQGNPELGGAVTDFPLLEYLGGNLVVTCNSASNAVEMQRLNSLKNMDGVVIRSDNKCKSSVRFLVIWLCLFA